MADEIDLIEPKDTVGNALKMLNDDSDDKKDDKGDDKDDTEDIKKALEGDDEEVKDEKKDDEDDEELELKEGDDKEDKKDEDEEPDFLPPVKKAELLKAFPELFKKFPQLEAAFHREKQFKELFPTIQDARETYDRANEFEKLETSILDGNITPMLEAVKNTDENALASIVDGLLPTLQKVYPEGWAHLINSVHDGLLRTMLNKAKETGSEDLKIAAQLFYELLHGKSDYKEPGKLGKEKDKPSEDIQNEKAQFVKEKFDTYSNDITRKVSNSITATVNEYIDPNNKMESYVKKNAVRDAIERIDESIKSDKEFKSALDRLWVRAVDNNFDKNSLDRIEQLNKSKARSVISIIIKEVRAEALGRRSTNRANDNDNNKSRKETLKPSRERDSRSNDKPDENTKAKRFKTAREILDED